MDESKQYPLNETKKNELRKKGIFPYSNIATKSFISGVIFLILLYIHSSLNYKNLNEDLKSLLFNTNNNNLLNIIQNSFLSFILITFLLFLIFILLALVQSSFLFLPFSKYPEGNLKTHRKKKKRLNINNISICSLSFFILFLITSSFLGIYNNEFVDLFTKKSPEPSDILSSLKIDTILLSFSFYFFFIAIFSFFFGKFIFYEEHKMTREELLSQGKDN